VPALRGLPRLKIPLTLHRRARRVWILWPQPGQTPGRRPARVRGHLFRARRDDDVRGSLDWTPLERTGDSQVVLRRALLRSACARSGRLESRTRAEMAPIFLIPYAPGLARVRALVPLRNMPVAKAEGPAGRRVPRASFCRAVSARASIYACKAFNTEERAGSNAEASARTTDDSRTRCRNVLARGRRQPLQCQHARKYSIRNSQPKIYLSNYIPEEWYQDRDAGMVRRRWRKAVRDDAQRYGEDKADSQQFAGACCPLHHARQSDRPGAFRVGSHPASGRIRARAPSH
jgi:hypothetical protein